MKEMRKSQRKRDAAWACEVFEEAPHVTVSMVHPDGVQAVAITNNMIGKV